MPSFYFEQIKIAITTKSQVIFRYKGRKRMGCPHAVGYKNGKEHVLIYQFGGESSGPLPEWRCMEVAAMSALAVETGEWHTANNHGKTQTCVDQVVLEVRSW